jgi:hypothetical protein
MLVSIIPLAHGKGTVTITRPADGSSYSVERQWTHATGGGGFSQVWVDYIDGESREDLKARAIGALGMLAHWPALQRAVQAERRLTDARAGNIRAAAPAARDELTIAVERITSRLEREHGGVILP